MVRGPAVEVGHVVGANRGVATAPGRELVRKSAAGEDLTAIAHVAQVSLKVEDRADEDAERHEGLDGTEAHGLYPNGTACKPRAVVRRTRLWLGLRLSRWGSVIFSSSRPASRYG